jgi:hypothetical protein
MLVDEAFQRIDAAADAGHPGAAELQSFFVGQVVGSFRDIRAAGDITREMAAECERIVRGLAAGL